MIYYLYELQCNNLISLKIFKKRKKGKKELHPANSFVLVTGRKTKCFKSAFCINPETKEGSFNFQHQILMNIVFITMSDFKLLISTHIIYFLFFYDLI
jgi:hypothetical protein